MQFDAQCERSDGFGRGGDHAPIAAFAAFAGLQGFTILVATLLPLSRIVFALAALNLEHVVFSLMSGIRPEDRSQNDVSYCIVTAMAYFSFLAAPFLLVAYGWLVFRRRAA